MSKAKSKVQRSPKGLVERLPIKRETADYTQRYIVRQGDTLSTIAARTYSDSTQWRPIARRNGIVNPADVAELDVGRALLVPRLPFLDPETGELYGVEELAT